MISFQLSKSENELHQGGSTHDPSEKIHLHHNSGGSSGLRSGRHLISDRHRKERERRKGRLLPCRPRRGRRRNHRSGKPAGSTGKGKAAPDERTGKRSRQGDRQFRKIVQQRYGHLEAEIRKGPDQIRQAAQKEQRDQLRRHRRQHRRRLRRKSKKKDVFGKLPQRTVRGGALQVQAVQLQQIPQPDAEHGHGVEQ